MRQMRLQSLLTENHPQKVRQTRDSIATTTTQVRETPI